MKVLFIVPLPPPITGQSLACNVLFEVLNEYHIVELINFSKSTLKQGITSWRRIAEVAKTLRDIWAKQRNADMIYLALSQSIPGNLKDLLIYLICFRKLPKMIIHLHGGGLRRIVFDKYAFLRFANAFFLKRLGGAVVLGKSLVPVFEGMVPRDKIYIVQNFAQDYLFLSRDEIESKFRKIKPLKILFLSNLIKGKGYEELAEAYNLLDSRSQEKIQIDFAGEFESEQQKRIFFDKIKDIHGLCYHGMVQGGKKRQLLADTHIFCLPTYYAYGEGQPIAILEAYAAGCVVITTNYGGIADIFEPGQMGYYVEKRSAKSIADTIETLLRELSQLKQIAIYNNTLAGNLYTESQYLSSMINIFGQIQV